MTDRIGIVTGGGDSPGLNTVIRSVVKAAALRGWETIGFEFSFEGMLEPPSYRLLEYQMMDSLLFRGGTVLGTRNSGVFSAKRGHGDVRIVPPELIAEAKSTFDEMGLMALVCVGGDGSLTIAQQLFEAGVPLVGVPKTIDNDLDATAVTFGFDSAVSCAVDALDRLSTTGESHRRVMVLEVMGRYSGWIATIAGIAGGADVILIPEIPFDMDIVCAKVLEREREGKHHTLVIVAEGAREKGGDYVTTDEGEDDAEEHLGGIGPLVTEEIHRRTGKECRCVVLGHLQRGGSPTAADRQLCTRFGVGAVELIAAELFGYMVALDPPEIVPVLISDAIGRTRTVPPDGELVRTARAVGSSFGAQLPRSQPTS
ncbi:MAG: 6-phosphofructokinase [Anaerolineae bacterium]